jgi:hypothetical protein
VIQVYLAWLLVITGEGRNTAKVRRRWANPAAARTFSKAAAQWSEPFIVVDIVK